MSKRPAARQWSIVSTAALTAIHLLTSAGAVAAEDRWIFASFSKTTSGESTWTDEVALPSREGCLELLDAAIDADVGVLPLVGVVASRTQNTVVGTDPRTHRMLVLTIYSCRPEPATQRRGPG